MRKHLLAAYLLLLGCSAADAQMAYTYVQQNGTRITNLGTAAFDVDRPEHPTVTFDETGNAVMTIGTNKVALLPMTDGGELVVEFQCPSGVSADDVNKVSKKFTVPYATVYSPFQLKMPETEKGVYAPTYDQEKHTLQLNSATHIAPGAVIPVGTGLILTGSVDFTLSADAATDTHTSALSGSALKIANPTKNNAVDGKTVYTLGHERTDPTDFGFFRYISDYLNPGLAWLLAPTVASTPSETQTKAISFSFDEDDVTGISAITATPATLSPAKRIESGRLVIVRGTDKYNANGQKVE